MSGSVEQTLGERPGPKKEDGDAGTSDGVQVSDRESETDVDAHAHAHAQQQEILVVDEKIGEEKDRAEDGVQQLRDSRDSTISTSSSRASTASEHSTSTTTTTDHHDHITATSQSPPKPQPVSLSRTSTVPPDPIPIPRPHRRGLLSHLTLIPEISQPTHYPRPTKWLITSLVALCAMAAPLGSAIVMPVLQDIAVALHASHTITNMSVAVYMLSMAIFPLWWSSFSERLGRRTIYIVSFALFILFAVLAALSSNIAMLIVTRTLSGGAAASVQAVGAGTIADLWEPKERGRAMGIFYLGPLCGPLFAPILGGALGAGLGWRSTQWFLVVYGGVTLGLIVFALPETLQRGERDGVENLQQGIAITASRSSSTPYDPENPPATATAPAPPKAPHNSTPKPHTTLTTHLRQTLLDPLQILLWLRHPPILLTVYYASITFGSLYILNISIQASFSHAPYNFSTLILGLLYIPNSAGYLLASFFGGRWLDWIMAREARKAGRYDERGRLVLRPMDRMRENAWGAAAVWPVALMVYGWTVWAGVIWIVPMVANFFFGVASMLIFALVSTMLTEFLPRRAASGIALNNFVRNIFSFTGAMVAEPVMSAIGNGWLMTILGVWSLVTGFAALAAMRRWGERWRVVFLIVDLSTVGGWVTLGQMGLSAMLHT